MVTLEVIRVLVFWILIGWSTGDQNGTNSNSITGGESQGSADKNKSKSSESGQIPQGNISKSSLWTLGKDIVGATNGPFSTVNNFGKKLLGGSRPQIPQYIVDVPSNNGSSGHPYLKRSASPPLNLTNNIIEVPPNNSSSGHPYPNRPEFAVSSPLNLTNNTVSININTVQPLQPNSSIDYAGPIKNSGNPSGNFFQQIGNGFKFVQDVAQNISTSASNNFAQWLSNAAQNDSSKSNASQSGGFSYEWYWPGGNWSFEISGNNVSRLTVGEFLNGSGFIKTQARNNAAHGHTHTREIVDAGNSETRIKKDEHHDIHPNTKNHPTKKKFNKKKHHREHEDEEHRSFI